MRKTHPLTHPRHAPARAVELLKHDLRKYLKRERRKALPDGADHWAFDCRIGRTEADAQPVEVKDLTGAIDPFVADGAEAVYVEILARPASREPRDR
jgi:hypothetical protein